MGSSVPKMAQPRLLDTSLSFQMANYHEALSCSGYIIVWQKDLITKFKIHQIYKCGVWPKLPNLKPAKFPTIQYLAQLGVNFTNRQDKKHRNFGHYNNCKMVTTRLTLWALTNPWYQTSCPVFCSLNHRCGKSLGCRFDVLFHCVSCSIILQSDECTTMESTCIYSGIFLTTVSRSVAALSQSFFFVQDQCNWDQWWQS